jgi:type IX secretion system PorP/SprF family membrane protein
MKSNTFYLKKLSIVLIGLAITYAVIAQQLPLFSQYQLNSFAVNPAIAGASGYNNINMMVRNQWLGYNNSPKTCLLSAEYRLLRKRLSVTSGLFGMKKLSKRKEGNVGLGAILYKDNNGDFNRLGGNFSYAYHIKLRNSQLSLGAAISFMQFRIDKENLSSAYYEPLLESNNFVSEFAFDASTGVYFKSRDVFFIGLGANELMQTIDLGRVFADDFKVLRHYYLVSGYQFILTREWNYEPSILIKLNEWMRYQIDLNMKISYLDIYWLGGGFRNNGDVILGGGVRYDKFYISYCFDSGFNMLMKSSFGSHEANLGLRIGNGERKQRWRNRYF